MYVFRTLVDSDIPMNEGCLRAIEIRIPERSMLAPEYPAAVVAGNVETSQVGGWRGEELESRESASRESASRESASRESASRESASRETVAS